MAEPLTCRRGLGQWGIGAAGPARPGSISVNSRRPPSARVDLLPHPPVQAAGTQSSLLSGHPCTPLPQGSSQESWTRPRCRRGYCRKTLMCGWVLPTCPVGPVPSPSSPWVNGSNFLIPEEQGSAAVAWVIHGGRPAPSRGHLSRTFLLWALRLQLGGVVGSRKISCSRGTVVWRGLKRARPSFLFEPQVSLNSRRYWALGAGSCQIPRSRGLDYGFLWPPEGSRCPACGLKRGGWAFLYLQPVCPPKGLSTALILEQSHPAWAQTPLPPTPALCLSNSCGSSRLAPLLEVPPLNRPHPD